MALWVVCLFAAILVALIVDSPADAQEVGPSGSFQTSYPFEIPSYRGLEPHLGLTYDSSVGNGLVGVGWELSGFSYIQRVSPGKDTPNYDENDVFFLDGMELIPCEPATQTQPATQSPSCQHSASPEYQAYATKTESFSRIAFDSRRLCDPPLSDVSESPCGRWYVWDKDGTKTTYAPHFVTPDGTYNWHVESVEDTLGNKVVYSYWADKDSAGKPYAVYPASIEYNGSHLIFYYEKRTLDGPHPDTTDTLITATGNEFSTLRYRLKTIDVTVDGQRARAYKLTYETRLASTSRSLLSEVPEVGSEAKVCEETDAAVCEPGTVTGGTALPPVTFNPADPGRRR